MVAFEARAASTTKPANGTISIVQPARFDKPVVSDVNRPVFSSVENSGVLLW